MVICDRRAGWSGPLQSCWTTMREGLVLDLEGRVPPKVPIDGCLLSDGPVLQLSFIWKIKENTFSRREGMLTQKTWREKRDLWPFGSSFYMFFFFLLLLLLPYVNWASQEWASHLRSSLRSSDLPLFYFQGLFPSFSFSHHHSGLLFPILTT